MLEARTRMLSRDYTLFQDGIEIGFIEQSVWREKATLAVGGYNYDLYKNGVLGGSYRMETNGAALADAQKSVWQHNYEVDCAEGHFSLKRRSIWGNDYVVLANGQEIGSICKASVWSRNAIVEIAGLPLVISCFLLWLVIISWQEAAAAAAH